MECAFEVVLMPGDIQNPFGQVKGYQFWALFGGATVVGPRILLAYEISLGVLTEPLIAGDMSIITTDILGLLLIMYAMTIYQGFLNT